MIFSFGSKFLRQTIVKSNIHKLGTKKQHDSIKIDEESIRKKMSEIKNRNSNQNAKIKEKLMPSYKIPAPNQKANKFRQQTNSKDLFAFEDYSLESRPGKIQISSIDGGEIQIDGVPYPPSLIIFPDQVFVWEVVQTIQLKPQHFQIITLITPKPDYIILGVSELNKVPEDVREYLQKNHQNFDIIEMFEAVSMFNIVTTDDIKVLGFFCLN